MGRERHAGIKLQQVKPTSPNRARPPVQRVETHGPAMAAISSPDAILALQRTIGNVAVNQLLHQQTPVTSLQRTAMPATPGPIVQRATDDEKEKDNEDEAVDAAPRGRSHLTVERTYVTGRAPVVQRFPASILTSSFSNWRSETQEVRPIGEGVSGSVYFFHSEKGPVNTVVVKPLLGDTPAASQFGDALLTQAFGITTPTSRIVEKKAEALEKNSDEYKQLFTMIKPRADAKKPPPTVTDPNWATYSPAEKQRRQAAEMAYLPIEGVNGFKVMGKAEGSSTFGRKWFRKEG